MTWLRPVDEAFIADLRARGTESSPVDVNSPTACFLAGITYRQLDFWTRTGRLHPSKPATGSGSQRRYTLAEVAVATTIRRLLEAGLQVQQAHDAARAHAAAPDDLVPIGPGLALIITDDDEREPTP